MADGLSAKQVDILQHSLGLDQYGRGQMRRNHFVTGEGSKDHADCMSLVSLGLMSRRANIEIYGGDDLFHVTEAGKRAVVPASPVPPKLSAGKQRYRDYLNSESSRPFIDWLKWKSSKAKEARYG